MKSILPICRSWKETKSCWYLVRHEIDEIDDPCLKSIMVLKPEIHLMIMNFSGHTQDSLDFIMQL